MVSTSKAKAPHLMQQTSEALSMITDTLRTIFSVQAAEMRSHLKGGKLDPFLEEAASRYDLKQEKLNTMLSHYESDGLGSTYRHNEQFAFVLRDASAPGRFRCQYFDRRGFFGHSTFNSVGDVLVELCDMGYTVPEPKCTVDVFSQTNDWLLGTQVTALVQSVNSGNLTMAEADELYLAYKQDLHIADAA